MDVQNEVILSLQGLTKSFGGLMAVNEVSFDLRARSDPRPDRPQWFRQDDLDKHCHGNA